MAYLTINGMTCRASDLSDKEDGIVTTGRGVTGGIYKDAIARKRSYMLGLARQQRAVADAWRRLLEGRGHHWSFDASLYSSKGLAPQSGHDATVTVGPPVSKYGTQCMTTGDQPLVYSLIGYDAWTLSVWVWTGSAWQCRQQTSDGVKLQDGVSGAHAWNYSPSGTGALSDPRLFSLPSDVFYDDLVILPYVLPTESMQQWAAHNAAFSPLPHLDLSGDVLGGEIVRVVSGDTVDVARDMDCVPPHLIVSCDLREV